MVGVEQRDAVQLEAVGQELRPRPARPGSTAGDRPRWRTPTSGLRAHQDPPRRAGSRRSSRLEPARRTTPGCRAVDRDQPGDPGPACSTPGRRPCRSRCRCRARGHRRPRPPVESRWSCRPWREITTRAAPARRFATDSGSKSRNCSRPPTSSVPSPRSPRKSPESASSVCCHTSEPSRRRAGRAVPRLPRPDPAPRRPRRRGSASRTGRRPHRRPRRAWSTRRRWPLSASSATRSGAEPAGIVATR